MIEEGIIRVSGEEEKKYRQTHSQCRKCGVFFTPEEVVSIGGGDCPMCGYHPRHLKGKVNANQPQKADVESA